MKMVDLISTGYQELQRELHTRPEGYGGKGHKWAPPVLDLLRRYDCWSVLDYGCGEGALVRRLKGLSECRGVRLSEYDPAMPGKDRRPDFADLVVVTDVLEHIEPDRLDAVLAHIRGLTRKVGFLVIATGPANKVMADGRNAHLIQEPRPWWAEQLARAGFTVDPIADDLPYHKKYDPSVQAKRWTVVVKP